MARGNRIWAGYQLLLFIYTKYSEIRPDAHTQVGMARPVLQTLRPAGVRKQAEEEMACIFWSQQALLCFCCAVVRGAV